MTRFSILCAAACIALSSFSSAQVVVNNTTITGQQFLLGNATAQSTGSAIRVGLNSINAAFGVTLSNTNWSGSTHAALTFTNNSSNSAILCIGIDSGSGANAKWMWTNIILPANRTTKVAIPLTNPTGLPLSSWPNPSDPSYSQVNGNGPVDRSNITKIRIANYENPNPIALDLTQIAGINMTPNTTGFIDVYGQMNVPFSGRVTSQADLQAQATEDLALQGNYPFSNDPYGGVSGTGSGATGKWSTAKQNGRWYIIDPSGNRFFSAGIVGAGWSATSYYTDRQSFFVAGAIPSQTGQFADHFHTWLSPITGQMSTGFNFYSANLERKFGSNWTNTANQVIANRMRNWGFNTLGPLSVVSGSNIVQTPIIDITGPYANIVTTDGAIPDVYDPLWATSARGIVTTAVTKLAGDLSVMGVFVDNELPFAKYLSNANYQHSLGLSVLAAPSSQPAKTKLISTLTLKYRTISALNSRWGSNFASWSALQSSRNFSPATLNGSLTTDLSKFESDYATMYFSTISSAIKSVSGFKGLYLGNRFLFYNSETLAAAKRFCDVVSFNAYSFTPEENGHTDMKAVDCPVMISEVGFGVNDASRKGPIGTNLLTEEDRIATYNKYMDNAATWPNLVGIHWYKWEDDPLSGRMWDSAAQSLGLVDIADQPYEGLVAAIRNRNSQFHNRLITP